MNTLASFNLYFKENGLSMTYWVKSYRHKRYHRNKSFFLVLYIFSSMKWFNSLTITDIGITFPAAISNSVV